MSFRAKTEAKRLLSEACKHCNPRNDPYGTCWPIAACAQCLEAALDAWTTKTTPPADWEGTGLLAHWNET